MLLSIFVTSQQLTITNNRNQLYQHPSEPHSLLQPSYKTCLPFHSHSYFCHPTITYVTLLHQCHTTLILITHHSIIHFHKHIYQLHINIQSINQTYALSTKIIVHIIQDCVHHVPCHTSTFVSHVSSNQPPPIAMPLSSSISVTVVSIIEFSSHEQTHISSIATQTNICFSVYSSHHSN